jgi:hypothetical protein
LFTHDRDLLVEAAARQHSGTPFAGVIYAQQLQAIIRKCIDDLEIIVKAGDLVDVMNRVIYLPF